MEPLESSSFLLRSVLVAFLGTFVLFFAIYIRSKRNTSNGLHLATEKDASVTQGYPLITPLPSFSWKTTEPLVFRPFKPKYHLTMGVSNLPTSDLIPMDKTYLSRLGLREQLLKDHPDVVQGVNINPDRPENNAIIEEAICEWYEYVMGTYLPERYPTMFRLVQQDGNGDEKGTGSGTMIESLVTGLKVPIDPVEQMRSCPPSSNDTTSANETQKTGLLHLLSTLGTWLDEDFLFLLPSSLPITPENPLPRTQYHLEAYTTYYPAGFDTRTKLARPLSEIHRPVPGYKQKLEKSMDRFFERLEVGRAVVRVNWSIMTKGTGLFAAFGGLHDNRHASNKEEMESEGFDGEETYLRCERQTLHRLPRSKALLFGFHTYAYPVKDIRDEGLGEELAVAIDGLRGANVPEMWPYKRGPYWGEAVKAFLRS